MLFKLSYTFFFFVVIIVNSCNNDQGFIVSYFWFVV